MKNPRVLILAVGFCVVAISAFAIGLSLSRKDLQSTNVRASESKRSDEQADVSGLTAENLKQRENTAEAIRNERAKLIKQLIELAAQEVERIHPEDLKSSYPWHDQKHLAILLLGDLRAAEAVSILFENLEYKNPKSLDIDARMDEGAWYPAVEALSKIGMPAIDSVIEKLGIYSEDSQVRRNCCWIIKKVLGVKLGRYKLQLATDETQNETVKKNLKAALPYLKTQQEKAAEERARRKKAGG